MAFEKGNSLGGRPVGSISPQTKLRNAIAESAKLEDVQAVLQAMCDQARAGGPGAPAAAKVYMEYMAGKPDANINITGGLDWAGLAGEID